MQKKNAQSLQKKNADISRNQEVLVLKGIFSGSTYECVLTYKIHHENTKQKRTSTYGFGSFV